MEEKEIWKDIVGFKGYYMVSNLGRVRSVERIRWNNGGYCKVPERILKPGKDRCGYLYVILCKEGIKKKYYVHRLVAEAFIPNSDNLPQINHIDENKENNHVDNLEWVTCKENINHGTHNKRMAEKQSKPVLAIHKINGLILEFPSIKEAARQTGINRGNLCSCLKGRYKTSGGFAWYYANGSDTEE